jgi:hypothetical protein
MRRTDIINYLIDKHEYKRYLEIGLGDANDNFNKVIVDLKHSVDPTSGPSIPTFVGTSDNFFLQLPENEKYDIIFIDGLHEAKQVYNDMNNALKNLTDGGTIVCHDINPHTEFMQRGEQGGIGGEWTGDAWKAWVKLRSDRPDLFMRVVDTDYGCGVIQRDFGSPVGILLCAAILDYDMLVANRVDLLNLIAVEEFLAEDEH